MPSYSKPEAVIFPVSSLPYILEKKATELQGCFSLDYVVRPGWIGYNPNKITVLTCNEMFQPVYFLPSIYNVRKQLIKVKTDEDLKECRSMFRKPLLFCITRRQQCEAMVNGFDTDFLILLDTSHPSVMTKLKKIMEFVEKKIKLRKKFCITVDLSEMLKEMSPEIFKKHVMWLNCSFCITNHCRPNPFLELNIPIMWCAMFPGFLFVSLPYRAYRKSCCEDKIFPLQFHPKFDACSKSLLLLYFFAAEHPSPGMYLKHEKLFIARLSSPEIINSLISLPAKEEIATCSSHKSWLKDRPLCWNWENDFEQCTQHYAAWSTCGSYNFFCRLVRDRPEIWEGWSPVGHIRWRIATVLGLRWYSPILANTNTVSNNAMKSVQRALPHVYLRTRMTISRLWCDPSHAPSGTFRELACVGPHCTCSKRLRHFLLCQMFHVCLIREMPANPRNRNTSTRSDLVL